MASTENELDRVRQELDARITAVTVEHVSMAQAIGSYAERFNGLEARMDATDMRIDYLSQDMDRRFDGVDRRFDEVNRRLEEVSSTMDRRFDSHDRRFEKLNDKIDNRFGWQTVFMAALALIVLFDDAVRAAMGL